LIFHGADIGFDSRGDRAGTHIFTHFVWFGMGLAFVKDEGLVLGRGSGLRLSLRKLSRLLEFGGGLRSLLLLLLYLCLCLLGLTLTLKLLSLILLARLTFVICFGGGAEYEGHI